MNMASSSANDSKPSTSTMDCDTNNAQEPLELFPGCTSINDFSQTMLKTVVMATKMSNDLPTGDDYDYYSTYDSVRNIMHVEAGRLLQLLQNVMRHHNVKGTISGTDHALELDEQFDVIMDANDQILERVATAVDEATGVKKEQPKLVLSAITRPNPAVASWNKKRTSTGSPVTTQLMTSKNIQRPQLSFRDKVDNSNKPFIPILRHKPNAKKPLQESLQLPPGVTLEDTENPEFVYPHPYQVELDEWQPSPEQLEQVVPQEPKSVDDTPVEYVDTVSDLTDLCELLKNEKEIAVDLEHHNYRSFQGFVCLMQISTRSQDFIIDTLALRSDIHLLNDTFTDPNITKVFHGADSDVEWLQRDFGVYVVNMFDTGQAARVLNLARFSLAHLLQVYCQVEADKQFQLSDWRMRPLHDKMIRYAQEDTHYLLYIYDRVRNELIQRGNEHKNLLSAVYSRSRNVCLKVYKRAVLTEESHQDLYVKHKKVFNAQQLTALRELYAWRDRTARKEDESYRYVLPNHMLMQMAEILPRERQGVLACCNPLPPLVRQAQHDIHSIILRARESTVSQAEEMKAQLEPSPTQHPHYQTSILACRHDLSKARTEPMYPQTPETGTIPKKRGRSLFRGEADFPLKRRPVLSALDPVSNRSATAAGRMVATIQSALSSALVKFIPVTEDSTKERILKPSAFTKTWRLKQNTASNANKRKSDVDLNTFAPEFAPPAKKKHPQANTAKPMTATTTTASTTAAQPSTISTTTTLTTNTSKPAVEGEKKKKKKGEQGEEKVPLSSRQMMKKKKKEKKMQKKTFVTDSPLPSPEPPSTTPTPPSKPQLPKGEKKLPTVLPTPTPTRKEEKKKKKKKRDNLPVTFATGLEPTTAAPVGGSEGGEEKKKKKRKKKKGNVEEVVVEENMKPFDYEAADKSAVTGKIKKQVHADVYNPHFRGDRKKQKKGKKERFGAKQKKSASFKAESGAGMRK